MKNLGCLKFKMCVSANTFHLQLEAADNAETAHDKVDQACKSLLANLIMESYSFSIVEPS